MAKNGSRIGLLATGFDQPYQKSISDGILRQMISNGDQLILVPEIPTFGKNGKIINSILTDMFSPSVFDGLLILSATINSFMSDEELVVFSKLFAPLPTLSVGIHLPGIPSIKIDNTNGMKQLMEHLFFAHGFASPAYIGGPTFHVESRERERVFRETAKRASVTLDEELVFHTSFEVGDGERSVRELIASKKRFDVLICANDQIALEAQAILEENGLRIPQACALTGFDNIPLGSCHPFSLSTVNQPLSEMGSYSVKLMKRMIDGETIGHEVMESTMIVRSSCGCPCAQAGKAHSRGYSEVVRIHKGDKQSRFLRMFSVHLLGAQSDREMHETLSADLKNLEAGFIATIVIPERYRMKEEKKAACFHSYAPNDEDKEIKRGEFPVKSLFPPGFPVNSVTSWLICPLRFRDENLGYLILENRPEILDVYFTVALQIANAIKLWEFEQKRKEYTENLENLVRERTSALEEEATRRKIAEQEILAISEREQRRIGQDLHDDICQRLASINILANIEERRHMMHEGEQNRVISSGIQDVIKRIKGLSRGLFPVILEQQGLPGALEEMAQLLSLGERMRVSFSEINKRMSMVLPPETALHLYRIAQEASQNALRHSDGTTVSIFLKHDNANLTLLVSDDGKGFNTSTQQGLGLSTMKYRACLLNAQFKINSGKSGTRVMCSISLKDDQ